jgi:TonB family protein
VASATVDLITNQQHYNIDDLLRLERAVRLNAGYAIRFDSGEMLHLSFDRGNLQIFIRLIPESVQPILASPFDLTVGEMTGVVLSVVLCAILGFLFSVSKPEEVKDLDNQPPRIAQFIYEKKPETPKAKPIELTEKEQTVPPPPPEQEKKPLKKVELSDKVAKSSAKKATVMTQHQKPLVKASEIREKNSNLKSPTFGSVKQGGSVKISNQESANAATVKKDISKQGLLGALSNNGLRDKLDQTYSGNNKGALGLGSQATGKVGLNQDHAGSDIGDKFRETGAGGKGTSTVGINSNLGTKGKSSGQDSYGNTGISTSKGTVAIESGGFEENFVGSIDKEAVRRVVKAGLREVKACYERGLRANSRLEGKVIVSWEIVEKGHVGSASVKSSTLNNKEVESCIVARLKSWQFPEPPAGTSAAVSYPFSFVKQQ